MYLVVVSRLRLSWWDFTRSMMLWSAGKSRDSPLFSESLAHLGWLLWSPSDQVDVVYGARGVGKKPNGKGSVLQRSSLKQLSLPFNHRTSSARERCKSCPLSVVCCRQPCPEWSPCTCCPLGTLVMLRPRVWQWPTTLQRWQFGIPHTDSQAIAPALLAKPRGSVKC